MLRKRVLLIIAALSFPALIQSAAYATQVNLPKTGQTTVYSAGDDGSLQKGVAAPSPRFTNEDGSTPVTGGVVVDQLTGLMWTSDANAPGPVGCSPGVTKTWQAALTYVACLNTNTYLGFNDWRLPNRKELRSLIDYSQSSNAAWLNTQGFNNAQAGYYWSSTVYARNTNYAWRFSLDDGSLYYYTKSSSYSVWPVRAGQLGAFIYLTISKSGTGGGSVTVDHGALIWSGSTGTAPYGTVVTVNLAAVANSGSTFAGWSDACTGSGACSITMDADKSVVATFNDDSAPVTSDAPGGGIYGAAQVVTLACDDGLGSGCANTYYCTGASCAPTTPYAAPIFVAASETVRYYSVDNAGNSEAVKTAVYTIDLLDSLPPTTTAAPAGGTYNSSQSVTLSCNDGSGSGCASTYYCAGAACVPSTPYTSPISVPASETVRYYSIDNAANSEDVKSAVYMIDSTSPTTAATPSGGIYNSSQSVTLSCSDESGSGCASTYYCTGAGCVPSTPYAVQISVAASTTVRYFSTDSAGNSEGVKSAAYTIDSTSPNTITAPYGGTYSSSQSVTLSCNDGWGSGCATTYYCTGAGCTPTTLYAAPISVATSTAVQYYSTDRAGNSEGVRSEVYTIVTDTALVKPTARFSWRTDPALDYNVLFDASNSTCPAGDFCSYAWDFGDGGTGSGVNSSHVYDITKASTEIAKLIVTATGANTTSSYQLSVTPKYAASTPTQISTNPVVNGFRVSGTYAVAGGVGPYTVMARWGDGTTSTLSNGTYDHIYVNAAAYTLTVYATDSGLNGSNRTTGTATASVTIAGLSVTGIVANSGGTALPGATMLLKNSSGGKIALTDASGNYTFTKVKPGTYTITAAKTGYAFSPPNASVTVTTTDGATQNFTSTP